MKLSVKLKCGYSAQCYWCCWWRTLRTICIETKRPNFNHRTFSYIDTIKTLSN